MFQTDSRLEELQGFVDQIPFLTPFHIKVKEARYGFVSVEVRRNEALFNHFETIQAGACFTIGEVTGGLVCGTIIDLSTNFLITKKVDMSFQIPCSETLIARASIDDELAQDIKSVLQHKKKMDVIVNVEIQSASGDLVAKGQNLYYLRLGIPRSIRNKRS